MIKISFSRWFWPGAVAVLAGGVLALFLHYYRPAPGVERLRLVAVDRPVGKLSGNDLAALGRALEKNLLYLERLPPGRVLKFGDRQSTAFRITAAQLDLLAFLNRQPDPEAVTAYLEENFTLFEVVKTGGFRAGKKAGPVLFTGYYVPTLNGSRKPDKHFRYPLYRKPDDLVLIETGRFKLERFARRLWPWIDSLPFIPPISRLHFPRLRGRLTRAGRVVPYYDREAIDYRGKLKGKGLELLWVDDDTDRFFLQIQGSGLVRLPGGGQVMVGYAGANGRPYRSIGGWLIRRGLIRREEVSMPAIREWIRKHPERREELFKVNPSYVFFRELPTPEPLGCYQVPLTARVSIATDRRLFPGGFLGLAELELPLFSESGEVCGWRFSRRLVLNQDTGGAIRGPFRVDLFCGSGRRAGLTAGILKQPGRLFILLPREKNAADNHL